jgi:hypothetical protein
MKKPLPLVIAVIIGASSFFAVDPLRAAADPSDLVALCFRGKTIQVPMYLVNRYLSVPGTLNGPCPSTP